MVIMIPMSHPFCHKEYPRGTSFAVEYGVPQLSALPGGTSVRRVMLPGDVVFVTMVTLVFVHASMLISPSRENPQAGVPVELIVIGVLTLTALPPTFRLLLAEKVEQASMTILPERSTPQLGWLVAVRAKLPAFIAAPENLTELVAEKFSHASITTSPVRLNPQLGVLLFVILKLLLLTGAPCITIDALASNVSHALTFRKPERSTPQSGVSFAVAVR
jgi:hypothetical protein